METETKPALTSYLSPSALPTPGTGPCEGKPDTMVCYCYNLTASQIRCKRAELGSLRAVGAETRAGHGCGGCRVTLESMFNEQLDDMFKDAINAPVGTPCVKPGQRLMTSFIISNGDLESKVFSCNATAPQLGDCDADTPYECAVIEPGGRIIYNHRGMLSTNHTFAFDTRSLNLPKPFFGMFALQMDRNNFGASRFNVQWGNSVGITSTHELHITGRPRVFLPVPVTARTVQTENDIFLAIINPWTKRIDFTISVFDIDSNDHITWDAALPPFGSMWLDATANLYARALERSPRGRFALKVDSTEKGHEDAVSVYFFFRNRATNLWSSQHL